MRLENYSNLNRNDLGRVGELNFATEDLRNTGYSCRPLRSCFKCFDLMVLDAGGFSHLTSVKTRYDFDCHNNPKVKCRLVQLKQFDRERGITTVEQKIEIATQEAIAEYAPRQLGDHWFVAVWVDRRTGAHRSFLGTFDQARFTRSKNEIYIPMSLEDCRQYRCLH